MREHRSLDQKWIEVRSVNFSIYSSMGEADARELLENLELFRAAILAMTHLRDASPRIPTEIYAFRGTSEYAEFRPDANVTGFFTPGLRSNWVALDAARNGIQARAILYHEYTHFLLRNEGRTRIPMWFDEGFAELLGAVDVRGSMVRIGAVPPHRLAWLQLGRELPYSRILRTRSLEGWSGDDASMFYTQSWLLVHYLTLGAMGSSATFTARLNRYLAQLDEGAEVEAAFRDAFGIEVGDLDGKLTRYRRKIPAFGLPEDRLSRNLVITVRAVPRDEIDTRLGWLAMHSGKVPLAQRYFEHASVANPNNPRAIAGMGDVHKTNQRWEAAEAAYQRSLELAPDDWQNHLELAEYFMHRAMTEESGRADRLASAREHFRRAIEIAPENPEGHAMLGMTYTVAGEPPEPGIASLERAAELLPSHAWIEYPLAHLHYRAGHRERAIDLLRSVVSRPHGEANREAVALLEEWEAAPPAEDASR